MPGLLKNTIISVSNAQMQVNLLDFLMFERDGKTSAVKATPKCQKREFVESGASTTPSHHNDRPLPPSPPTNVLVFIV